VATPLAFFLIVPRWNDALLTWTVLDEALETSTHRRILCGRDGSISAS
jgi:hypothetical protein